MNKRQNIRLFLKDCQKRYSSKLCFDLSFKENKITKFQLIALKLCLIGKMLENDR